MKSIDTFGLRPIWNASLEVYSAIAEICDSHGLRYYVTDGTALGAVRHKGFIPWDDDFDISMPRPDYEVFKRIASVELPGHLKFVDFHNTPEFGLLFGKVQDCRREKIATLEKTLGFQLSNGIFVDVFPIDGYPTSWLSKGIVYIPSRFFARLTRIGHWGKFIGMRACEFFVKSFSYEKAELTGRSCSALTVLRRKGLAKKVWGVPNKVEFDGGGGMCNFPKMSMLIFQMSMVTIWNFPRLKNVVHHMVMRNVVLGGLARRGNDVSGGLKAYTIVD